MQRTTVLFALSATMTLILAGCSIDVPTLPSGDNVSAVQEQQDMATAALSVTGEELDLMFGTAANVTGSADLAAPAPGLTLNVRAADVSPGKWTFSGLCEYNAESGRHVCPTVTNGNGLSLDRSYAFFNQDAAVERFDAATTDSINFQPHLSGTVTRENGTATVDRTASVTVASDPTWDFHRLWNGTGSGTSTADFTDGTIERSYSLSGSTTLTDVVTAIPHSQNPWPLSGSITHVMEGERTREGSTTVSKSVSYAAVITFNGGSIVPLDIGPTLDNLNTHGCIDLAARKLSDRTCRD